MTVTDLNLPSRLYRWLAIELLDRFYRFYPVWRRTAVDWALDLMPIVTIR